MSHLATEKQMISDVPSDVHLCSLMFTYVHWTSTAARTELSSLSGAHQRVSTLQRLKPDVLKHDLQSNISKVLRFFAISFQEIEARTVLTIP